MKTAMQELIEHLNHIKEFNTMIPGIIKGAEKLLEKEKEQIMNAFVECWKANMPDGFECKLNAKDYYNQTYNQNN